MLEDVKLIGGIGIPGVHYSQDQNASIASSQDPAQAPL